MGPAVGVRLRCNIDPWGFHLVVQTEGDDDVLRGAVLLFPHPRKGDTGEQMLAVKGDQ